VAQAQRVADRCYHLASRRRETDTVATCDGFAGGRAQDGTTTRSAGRASSRYEIMAASEPAAIRAIIERAECLP